MLLSDILRRYATFNLCIFALDNTSSTTCGVSSLSTYRKMLTKSSDGFIKPP